MTKGSFVSKFWAPTEDELVLINNFSRRELTADDVNVFSFVLCDNEIDKDFERFSIEALNDLAKMYIGKTGALDQSECGRAQNARIFKCQVMCLSDEITLANELYYRIEACAYITKPLHNSEKMQKLINGFYAKANIGLSVSNSICSICGTDQRTNRCVHKKGEEYPMENKILCHRILSSPADVYEWSLVAAPTYYDDIFNILEIDEEEFFRILETT